MRITGTAIKLGAMALVLLLFTAIIIVVFGQMRFDRTKGYSAIFRMPAVCAPASSSARPGVEVGKVTEGRADRRRQRGRRSTSPSTGPQLFQGTTASIRYLNLIGDRYMELKRGDDDQQAARGGTIPLERTEPALDLDALIGGFRPLFRALDPDKVNNIAQSIITIFQGQGGTINDILDQTASLTSALADRDQAIGEVIRNLNTVLDTTVKHQKQFDETVVELREADHRAEEPQGPDRELRRRHQRRRGHDRRSASPTTVRCCRAPSASSRSSSSRSSIRRTS